MTTQKLEEILQKREGIDIKFKTSQFELNKDAFESICALLNCKGGHLLLGVNNKGEVEGVFDDCVQNIINQIITSANNPLKLNPIVYLSPEIIDYKGKKVIHVLIPESSQVHATNGKIFDRNEDGDFNITGQSAQVNKLYLRKQDTYTENRIYPYVRISDFKPELFVRIRTLAKNQRPNHPWQEMTDEELVRSAGLVRYDYNTDRHGYTLAAVLLLGKDEVIRDILSYHKTDAIVRIENIDRYEYCGKYTQDTSPQFVDEEVFKTIIPLKSEEFGENREKGSEKILELIISDPYISAQRMAEIIEISERAVEKHLARLKANKMILRVGHDKGGYWKVRTNHGK